MSSSGDCDAKPLHTLMAVQITTESRLSRRSLICGPGITGKSLYLSQKQAALPSIPLTCSNIPPWSECCNEWQRRSHTGATHPGQHREMMACRSLISDALLHERRCPLRRCQFRIEVDGSSTMDVQYDCSATHGFQAGRVVTDVASALLFDYPVLLV
ncbi:hypothetical protein BV20DRAFT_143476 [Pilatotrama ljubarskyi]|nr:hypothetical protein BV20DRAFT_143476 [Pilatotrama ljubarskyi]